MVEKACFWLRLQEVKAYNGGEGMVPWRVNKNQKLDEHMSSTHGYQGGGIRNGIRL